ncbi:DUF952 domain-containing protein [Lysobacter antibioticus]|uniref:DUF952 domain-containing protein n=1 Tax=Lysobacter antibioticus TaxID=84531 RepID=UPI0009DD084F|nr:DUF952 domain-containing protein [Lysobacter antibioticus]
MTAIDRDAAPDDGAATVSGPGEHKPTPRADFAGAHPGPRPDTIFHFAAPADWHRAQATGAYAPDGWMREGFVHCATQAQLAGVIERHQRGRGALLVLSIDAAALGTTLRYDWSERSGDYFPHVYAPIPLDAVRAVEPFTAPP